MQSLFQNATPQQKKYMQLGALVVVGLWVASLFVTWKITQTHCKCDAAAPRCCPCGPSP